MISIKVSERNGKVVAATQTDENRSIIVDYRRRNACSYTRERSQHCRQKYQGVRLIRTAEDEHVVSLERICEVDERKQ